MVSETLLKFAGIVVAKQLKVEARKVLMYFCLYLASHERGHVMHLF